MFRPRIGSSNLCSSLSSSMTMTPQGRLVATNHHQLDCVFNSLFRLIKNKAIKFRIAGPSWRELTDDQWISIKRTQYAGRDLTSWRHHVTFICGGRRHNIRHNKAHWFIVCFLFLLVNYCIGCVSYDPFIHILLFFLWLWDNYEISHVSTE